MEININVVLNGTRTEFKIRPDTRLIDVLRDKGGCLSLKEGCSEGECGACSVLLDMKVICSCITLAATVDGCEILTVEGVGEMGKQHVIQKAFVEEMGTQCGFCTPGMILAAYELLHRNKTPSTSEVVDALSGNLCRCTGYTKAIQAVERAASADRE